MSHDAILMLPDPAALDAVPLDDLPALIVQLNALSSAAAMRMRRRSPSETVRLLTAMDAAELLRVNVEWVEKRSRTLPFRVSLGDGTVRYDPDGLRKWRAGRTGAVR
jgi:hypothetical protein